MSTIAWLLDEDGKFVKEYLTPAAIPEYDHKQVEDPTRHFMSYVYWVNRDAIFEEMFEKLVK